MDGWMDVSQTVTPPRAPGGANNVCRLWTIENTSSNTFFFEMQQLKKLSAQKLLLQKMAQKQKEQQQKCVESVQNLIISNMINLCILYFYQYPTIYAYNMFN